MNNNGNNALSKVKMIGIVGAIVLGISCFLDFFTASIIYEGKSIYDISVNYFISNNEMKDGVYIFALAISIVIMIFKKKEFRALIMTVISGGILAMDYMDVQEKVAELQSKYDTFSTATVEVSYGPAFYLGIVGIVILGVYFFLHYKNVNSAKPVLTSNNFPNSSFANPQMPNQYPNNMNQNMDYNNQMANQYPNNQNMNYNNQNNMYPGYDNQQMQNMNNYQQPTEYPNNNNNNMY